MNSQVLYGQDALNTFVGGISKLLEVKSLQGHTEFQDLPISIENRKGSVREGTNSDGTPWKTKMKYPYGYIRGTKGVDGDQLDCFVGSDGDSPYAFVVHTNDPDSGKFDEDKIMLGFKDKAQAKKVFLQHYDDPKFYGGMTQVPMLTFKEVLDKINKKSAKLTKKKIEEWADAVLKDFKESSRRLPDGSGFFTATVESQEFGVKGMKWGVREEKRLSPEERKVYAKAGASIQKLSPDVIESREDITSHKILNKYIKELKQTGSSKPIVVTDLGAGKYLLEDGHHRWKAAKALGKRIDAVVLPKKYAKSSPTERVLMQKIVDFGRGWNESRVLEAKRPRIFYARSLQKYGTEAEEAEIEFLKEKYPDHRIVAPRKALHETRGMKYYHDMLEDSDMVVISPRRKNRVTAGVWSEARHAKKMGIKVKILRGSKLKTLGKLKTTGGSPWGDFGIALKREKKKR